MSVTHVGTHSGMTGTGTGSMPGWAVALRDHPQRSEALITSALDRFRWASASASVVVLSPGSSVTWRAEIGIPTKRNSTIASNGAQTLLRLSLLIGMHPAAARKVAMLSGDGSCVAKRCRRSTVDQRPMRFCLHLRNPFIVSIYAYWVSKPQ
jgi:hypothetical protein